MGGFVIALGLNFAQTTQDHRGRYLCDRLTTEIRIGKLEVIDGFAEGGF